MKEITPTEVIEAEEKAKQLLEDFLIQQGWTHDEYYCWGRGKNHIYDSTEAFTKETGLQI